jgi:hypothetical protein
MVRISQPVTQPPYRTAAVIEPEHHDDWPDPERQIEAVTWAKAHPLRGLGGERHALMSLRRVPFPLLDGEPALKSLMASFLRADADRR